MHNKHEEYIRITEDKHTAVLMVHGIVGSPRYFDDFIPLVPEGWSIYNILLDGHGKCAEDFAATCMQKWRAQVDGMLGMLYDEYDEIIVMAHSMGTLLVMDAANYYKDKIKHMVLFAPPLVPFAKPYAFWVALKVVLNSTDKTDKSELAAARQYSIKPDWKMWKYIGFIPRYMELLSLAKKMRSKVGDVAVPCDVFVCAKDEMVSRKSEKYLTGKNFTKHVLENSSHNLFGKNDLLKVAEVIYNITGDIQ